MIFSFLVVLVALILPNEERIKEYPKTDNTVETMYIRIRHVPIGGMVTEVVDTLIVYEEADSATVSGR